MEYTKRLRAEIERLRDLLEENGIDPEPYVAPPPQFGPPTLMEHITQQSVNRLANKIATDLMERNSWWSNFHPESTTVSVRLPMDFTVRS